MAQGAKARTALTIDYIADIACPWCYIGLRRLAQARALRPERPIETRWQPFLLNPTLPAEGMDRATYVRAKFGSDAAAKQIYQRIEEAGQADDIAFDLGRMKRTPNTLQAHRLIMFAQARGSAEPLIERLFRALFIDGRDVGDSRVLVEEAAAAGLAPELVEPWLAGRELADAVVRSHKTAQWQGVRGVPVFVAAGEHAISGAQPPEVLAGLLDVAAAESATIS